MKVENNCFQYIILFELLNTTSLFAAMHLYINSLKSGLIHLTGQPNSQKVRGAKVEDGFISEYKFKGIISVDWYTDLRSCILHRTGPSFSVNLPWFGLSLDGILAIGNCSLKRRRNIS